MKIAALQMVSGVDLEQNLREVARLLALASAQGTQLAVLPENFALFNAHQLSSLAEEEERSHKIQQQLAYLAQQYGLALWACINFANHTLQQAPTGYGV